jgi:lipopolysaccharide export system permease protein
MELIGFVRRIRMLGGEVHQWLTDLHLRVAFPLSNLVIVLFSVPIAYNRRRRSLAVGFGISLIVCFLYFGLVKMGQTMGQKGSIHPFWAAWLGNQIMGIGGIINLIKTRK